MQVQALTSKIKELEEKLTSPSPASVVAAGAVRLPVLHTAPCVAAAALVERAANADLPIEPGGLDEVVPVIVFACCRVGYLERTLKTLLERMPITKTKFEVWVSQDGEVIYMYIHIHVQMDTRFLLSFVCARVCVFIYIYVCLYIVCVCVCVRARARACVCVYIFTYMYVCMWVCIVCMWVYRIRQ